MDGIPTRSSGVGLERSCGEQSSDWIRQSDVVDGVELLEAWFHGSAYHPHRHDTYAICLTDTGVQAFGYRGASHISTPGRVVVLHPDEIHDGYAGSDAGFGYRQLYVDPALIFEAETTRVVRSTELEAVTGLSRYDLARQFRTMVGTSPYRYSLMRRLGLARSRIAQQRPLVDVALETGFADQAHCTRMFTAAYEVTPARYGALRGRM